MASQVTANQLPKKQKEILFQKKFTTLDWVKGFSALMIATFFYIISNEKCPYLQDDECVKDFLVPLAPKWVIQLFISGGLLLWLFISSGLKRTLPRIFTLLALADFIYLCYFFNPIVTKQIYGECISIFQHLIIGVISSILIVSKIILKSWQKSKVFTMIIFPTILVLTQYKLRGIYHSSCDKWTSGIGNQKAETSEQTCELKVPSICIYELTQGLFDFSKFMPFFSKDPDEKIIKQYFPQGYSYIGFPRTEFFSENQRYTLTYPEEVIKNTIGLNDLTDQKAQDLEVFLNLSSIKESHFIIDVKRNETLINERTQKNKTPDSPNIIVFFIDAVSRASSMRNLNKTLSWFEKYMNEETTNRESYQFFKYLSIAPFTSNNLWKSLWGIIPNIDVNITQRIDSIIKDFKDAGYITAHATDFCQVCGTDLIPGQPIKDIPYDHEGNGFACDPHYHNPESPYSMFRGPYSFIKRMLYGKNVFEYAFEYGSQFWEKYDDQKKFLYFEFIDAHEASGEVLKYMDDDLAKFLETLENKQQINDTIVLLYSDHGLHMQAFLYFLGFDSVHIEQSLPSLYVNVPSTMNKKFGKNLKQNQQKLVSVWNIHDTFKTLAYGEQSKFFNSSILSDINPKITCEDIKLVESPCFCNYAS